MYIYIYIYIIDLRSSLLSGARAAHPSPPGLSPRRSLSVSPEFHHDFPGISPELTGTSPEFSGVSPEFRQNFEFEHLTKKG